MRTSSAQAERARVRTGPNGPSRRKASNKAPRTSDREVQSRYKTHIQRSGSYNALFMRLYGACPRMRSGGRGVRLRRRPVSGVDGCGVWRARPQCRASARCTRVDTALASVSHRFGRQSARFTRRPYLPAPELTRGSRGRGARAGSTESGVHHGRWSARARPRDAGTARLRGARAPRRDLRNQNRQSSPRGRSDDNARMLAHVGHKYHSRSKNCTHVNEITK